jgi:hypothetical protein
LFHIVGDSSLMMPSPPTPNGDFGGGGNHCSGTSSERTLPEPPASQVDNTNVTSVSMEIDDAPPETLFPGVTTCKDFTVHPNTAVDEETVTTRGSSGPRPNTPVTQQTVTLKLLVQSTEALSSREVAGRFLTVLHAIVSIKAPVPNIVYDMNNHPLRNFSQDNASNFDKYLNIEYFRDTPNPSKAKLAIRSIF